MRQLRATIIAANDLARYFDFSTRQGVEGDMEGGKEGGTM